MNKRLVMQVLAGGFALGIGTAVAGPEATKPADPYGQPARPSATTPTPSNSPGTVNRPATPPGTAAPHGTMGSPPPSTPPPPSATAGTTASASLTPAESRAAKRILTELHNVNGLEIALGRLAQQKSESQAIKDYAQMLVTEHESADRKVLDFANTNNIMLTTKISGAAPTGTATDAGVRAAATVGTQGATGTATATAGTNPAAATGNTPATAPGTATAGTATATATADATMPELDAAGRRTITKLEKLEGAKFDKAFLTEMVRGHSKTLGKLKAADRQAKNAELKTLLGDVQSSVQMHLDKAKELQRAGTASADPATKTL